MRKETYDALDAKAQAFADLLLEISKSLKRLADLMDREINE